MSQGLAGAAGAAPGFGAKVAGGFTSPLGLAGTAAALATTDFSDPRSIGAGAGSVVGGAVGQALIPIPFVGAAIGSAVGQFAGDALGGLFGDDEEEEEKERQKKLQGQANRQNIVNNLRQAAAVAREDRLRNTDPRTGFRRLQRAI